MSLEDAKRFHLAMINHYVSLVTSSCEATSVVMCYKLSESWEVAERTAGAIAVRTAFNAVTETWEAIGEWKTMQILVFDAATASKKAIAEVLRKTAFDVVRRGGTSREVTYAICESVILNRGKIKDVLAARAINHVGLKALKEPKALKALKAEGKCKILRALMTYEGKKINQLKQTIPLQLHWICFSIEQLIKCEARLSREDEGELMKEHESLLMGLNIRDSYVKLFNPRLAPDISRILVRIPSFCADHACALLPCVECGRSGGRGSDS